MSLTRQEKVNVASAIGIVLVLFFVLISVAFNRVNPQHYEDCYDAVQAGEDAVMVLMELSNDGGVYASQALKNEAREAVLWFDTLSAACGKP